MYMLDILSLVDHSNNPLPPKKYHIQNENSETYFKNIELEIWDID